MQSTTRANTALNGIVGALAHASRKASMPSVRHNRARTSMHRHRASCMVCGMGRSRTRIATTSISRVPSKCAPREQAHRRCPLVWPPWMRASGAPPERTTHTLAIEASTCARLASEQPGARCENEPTGASPTQATTPTCHNETRRAARQPTSTTTEGRVGKTSSSLAPGCLGVVWRYLGSRHKASAQVHGPGEPPALRLEGDEVGASPNTAICRTQAMPKRTLRTPAR